MLLTAITSALALCGSAAAFADTSPFILLSTKSFDEIPNQAQIQTSSHVESSAKAFLKSCPTDSYLVISQPNLHARDLRGRGAAPNLRDATGKAATSWTVSDVYGEILADDLASYIREACSKKDVEVKEVKLAPLPSRVGGRTDALGANDHILGESIKALSSPESYTVLYLSSPAEMVYEAEFQDPLYDELKKRASDYLVAGPLASNKTEWNKLPLFEKYVFFHPGLFMALPVAIILISILYFGIRSLSSLTVSYGAFDKENGPAQQRKQQ